MGADQQTNQLMQPERIDEYLNVTYYVCAEGCVCCGDPAPSCAVRWSELPVWSQAPASIESLPALCLMRIVRGGRAPLSTAMA